MSDSRMPAACASSDRMPAREAERIYATYGSFLRTWTLFGSGVWVFLVGSALPAVGDTRLAILGYACGMVIAMVPVLLSSALPSFRYGIDSIDASKATLGPRGAVLPLVGLLLLAIGWAAVVMSMVARGAALLVAQAHDTHGVANETLVVTLSFAVILGCWILLRRGFRATQRLNDLAGPGLILLATLSLCLLMQRYGWRRLWETNVALSEALTTDRLKAFAYAVEFGVATSFAWWPFLGPLYRLLKYRRDAVGPSMIGASLLGGGYCSAVAALAAVNLGTTDPVMWIIGLAGRPVGVGIVTLVLLMNIPVIGMLIYFAATSVQQISALARVPLSWLVAFMLVPLVPAAFNTQWAVSHIIAVATYGGLQFLGITAVTTVDYYLLRRQSVALEHLFVAGRKGHYWFWGGVNWVAVAVTFDAIPQIGDGLCCAHLAVGMTNSAPLGVPCGQRCMTDFCLV